MISMKKVDSIFKEALKTGKSLKQEKRAITSVSQRGGRAVGNCKEEFLKGSCLIREKGRKGDLTLEGKGAEERAPLLITHHPSSISLG